MFDSNESIDFRVVYPQRIYTNAVLLVFVDDQMMEVRLAGNEYLTHWLQCSCSLMAKHYDGMRDVVLGKRSYLLKAHDWQYLTTVLIDYEVAEILVPDGSELH